jgi:hypothetical protein
MGEIDDLLAQIKNEYESEQQPQQLSSANPKLPQEQQKTSPLDNLLAEVKQEVEEQKRQPNQYSLSDRIDRESSFRSEDNLITQLQQEFQEAEKIEQQRKQQQLEKEKQRQQKQEQRRRQELEKQAQEWLKNLKPNSDESLWFQEFSYAYDSKVEAAIDYLQAIRETRFLG